MTDERLQKVSAFIDGECSSGETEHVIDHALANEAARGAWTRYHFIGNAMRGELPRYVLRDFVSRVRNTIAPEPIVLAPTARRRVWLKPVSGLAIAASVAVVAIVGVRQFGEAARSPAVGASQIAQVTSPAPIVIAQPIRSPMTAPSPPVQTPETLELPDDRQRLRLNSYLVNYSEQRATLGSPGMLSYVKVVGYGQEQ